MEGLVPSHGGSTGVGLEIISVHELGSAVSADFSIMIFTSLSHNRSSLFSIGFPELTLVLGCRNSWHLSKYIGYCCEDTYPSSQLARTHMASLGVLFNNNLWNLCSAWYSGEMKCTELPRVYGPSVPEAAGLSSHCGVLLQEQEQAHRL